MTEDNDETLLLEKNLASQIASAVFTKTKEIIQCNPTKKWKVLASIVISSDEKLLKVICITSGSKCVKGKALCLTGSVINDCHAEILARRCFIHYLYSQLNSFSSNPGIEGKMFCALAPIEV